MWRVAAATADPFAKVAAHRVALLFPYNGIAARKLIGICKF
ncbi:hypothetical protein AB4Y32_10260 [Paraburkholderia phymatum]|uniref:Uncharacterized protein n=1 Tax=Paraburkholderia phymatum TaxID=148447 RepID=A0ACC6TXV8_9BURK